MKKFARPSVQKFSAKRLSKTSRTSVRSKFFTLSLGLMLAGLSHSAQAASATWNATPTDGFWEAVPGENNWSTGDGTFPGAIGTTNSADVATFSTSSVTSIAINSAAGNTSPLNIFTVYFTGANPSAFTIGSTTGNALLFSANSSITNSLATSNIYYDGTGTAATQTINAPIQLQGGALFNNASTVTANQIVINGSITGVGAASPFALTLRNGTASASPNQINGVISNGTFTALTVAQQTGSWTLSNANNSYTGATQVNGGTMTVTTLANGGVNSSIGASTNAAANLLLSGNGILLYNGGAMSTDRLFTIASNSGGQISSSGTGAVNFTNTGAVAYSGTASIARTLTLRGTNTGANTLSELIGDTGTAGGVVSLVKSDAGTWVLTNANTYSGTTVISTSGGVLQIGNGGTTGSLLASGGAITINTGGNLTFNRSNAVTQGTDFTTAVISGAGGLTQAGSGTLTLTAANTYSGGTTISSGTLKAGIANAIGGTSGSLSVASGATLDMNGFSLAAGALNGAGTIDNVTTGTTNTLTIGNGNADGGIYSGVIQNTTGTLSVVKNGTGTITLSGNNTFKGSLTVNGGTLVLSGTNSLTTLSSGNVVSAGSGGTLSVNSLSGALGGVTRVNLGGGTNNGRLLYTGTGETSAIVFGTTASTASSATLDQSGSGNLVFTGNTAFSNNITSLTLQGSTSGTGTFSGVIGATTTQVIKAGTGTWTLSGANTYTGTTTINGGTLQVNTSTSTSTAGLKATTGVTVNTGGMLTLANSGGSASVDRINNAATVALAGGTLASINSAKEGSALTLTTGTPTGTSAVGLGALTLTANSTINLDSATNGNLLVFAAGSSLGTNVLTVTNWGNANFSPTNNSSGLSTDDRLVFNQDMSGSLSQFDFGSGPGVNVAEVALGDGFYEVGSIAAVPEPSTWVAGVGVLGILLASKRRRLVGLWRSGTADVAA